MCFTDPTGRSGRTLQVTPRCYTGNSTTTAKAIQVHKKSREIGMHANPSGNTSSTLVFLSVPQPAALSSEHFQVAFWLTPSHSERLFTIFSSSLWSQIASHTRNFLNPTLYQGSVNLVIQCATQNTLCYISVLHLCICIIHLFIILNISLS